MTLSASKTEPASVDPTHRETVTLQSTVETQFPATVYGPGDGGSVLVPHINLDSDSWETQAELFSQRGHTAMAIDEDPDHRIESVPGAIHSLREEVGNELVLLIGASSGGEAAVRANARADGEAFRAS